MDWQPIQGVFPPSSVPRIGFISTVTVTVNEACKKVLLIETLDVVELFPELGLFTLVARDLLLK